MHGRRAETLVTSYFDGLLIKCNLISSGLMACILDIKLIKINTTLDYCYGSCEIITCIIFFHLSNEIASKF